MKKIKLCRIFGVISVFLVLIFGTVAVQGNASAAGLSSVLEKSRLEGLYQCYKTGGINSLVDSKEYASYGFSSVPNGKYVTIYDSYTTTKSITCSDLVNQYFSNKFPAASADVSSTLTPFMKSIGYTAANDSSGKSCATYTFDKSGTTKKIDLCTNVNANGTIADKKMEVNYNGSTEVVQFEIGSEKVTLDCNTSAFGKGGCSAHTYKVGETNFKTFAQALQTDISNTFADSSKGTTPGWAYTGFTDPRSKSEISSTYQLMAADQAGNKAIGALSSYSNRFDIALTEDEQKALLTEDIKTFYGYSYYQGSEANACNLTGEKLNLAKQSSVHFALNISSTKTCYVSATKHTNDRVPAFNSSGYLDGTTMSFKEVIDKLNTLTKNTSTDGNDGDGDLGDNGLDIGTPGEPDPSTPGSDGYTPTDSGNPENTETPICTQVSGVLTWVLCPVLDFIGDTAGDVYKWIADNFIEVDASTLFQRNEGVYEGWSNFRNFANVLFAILFAVVILAQITGIGISNYNVKKILPRLIITVVLVNVSFILCQLAVDLSNIVGKSINDLLEGFAGGNAFNFGEISGLTEELVSGTEGGLSSKIQGVTSLLAIGALGVATWRLWLPMLFLSLISALVGVLFFFLILGIRQAGVIIAVVIAPVAIVCYSLPNTKTLFDKWWKIFSALLMVYPICGAMMGGGTYAATLMVRANSGDFLYFIIAMLLKIVPFFFVPSILKNSLNGIGMLGAKINGLSKTAQGRASGAVKHSDRFQDFDRRMKVGRANAAMKRHEFLANTRAGKALGKASESLNNYSKSVAANKNATVADKILGGIAGAAAAPRNANRRQYDRNARTVLAGEREQAMADNLNLDAIRSGESRRQFEMDKANEDALYRDSIQYTDDAAVAAEYKTALDDFLVDPTDNRKRAKVAALQDRLSRTDDGAAFMMSTLTETAADKSMAGDTAALASLQTAAGYIDADGLKKKNRNFYKTAQDFANGNFSMADDRSKLGSYEVEVPDGHGGKTKRNVFFASKYNNTKGGIKYSASSFAGLDDSAFKQILQGVESGEITGENLQTVMDVANDALTGAANGTITMDAGAIDHARKITSAGYARSAVTATKPGATPGAAPITVRTEGSQAIARAGAQSINKLVQDVQAGSSALSDKDAVSIAQNMQTAINDDTNMFENSQIEGMRQFVTAVNQRITSDPSLNGGTKFDLKQFESGSVKIRGAQKPQKLDTPTIPTNWKQVPDITAATPGTMKWVETNSAGLSVRDLSPDEIQHIADVQEAQKIVRQENVKRGFGPTRPGSPTP